MQAEAVAQTLPGLDPKICVNPMSSECSRGEVWQTGPQTTAVIIICLYYTVINSSSQIFSH